MNFVWGFTLKTDFGVDASKLFRRWVSFFPFNVLTFLAQQVTGAVNLRWHQGAPFFAPKIAPFSNGVILVLNFFGIGG